MILLNGLRLLPLGHRQSGSVATVPSKPHQLAPSRCSLGLTLDVHEEARRYTDSLHPLSALLLSPSAPVWRFFKYFSINPFLSALPRFAYWSNFKNTVFFLMWWTSTWYIFGKSVWGSWRDLTLPPRSGDSANPPRSPADDHDSTSMSRPARSHFCSFVLPTNISIKSLSNSLLNKRLSSLLSYQ